MSRLTTNKPVDEMSMLELAYNSCYAKDGKAMYEDYETVRDARDFARNLYKAYLDEELPTDDEEFDGRMMDDLQFESEVHLRGLIALFYRNLWVMADLREKLKAYEDKEEQGLLIELPCKVGDTVWEADEDSAFYLTECVVDRFGFDRTGMIYCIYESKDGTYTAKAYLDEFGKSIITTNEEVQQRLAKMHSEAEEALTKMGGKLCSKILESI